MTKPPSGAAKVRSLPSQWACTRKPASDIGSAGQGREGVPPATQISAGLSPAQAQDVGREIVNLIAGQMQIGHASVWRLQKHA